MDHRLYLQVASRRDHAGRMEERRLTLSGSRTLLIREMQKADAAGLEDLYIRLCEDDLYKRFFSGRPPRDTFIEKMASVGERGGFGVVAVMHEPGLPSRLVAEASFSPLPNGNAEVGVTVDPSARGWLGPYLLDILVHEAARRSIPNLEAEVLATNRQMQALLESRGSAVIEHSDRPAIVRLCIGTTGRAPAWSRAHDRPRLLVEIVGGRWRSAEAAKEAGFEVLACPGVHRKLTRCPAMAGAPCPLAAQADVIVDAIRDAPGQALLRAHHDLHPGVPVCVDLLSREAPEAADGADGADGGDGGDVRDGAAGGDVPKVYADMDDIAVVGLLQRLVSTQTDMDASTGTDISTGTNTST